MAVAAARDKEDDEKSGGKACVTIKLEDKLRIHTQVPRKGLGKLGE